MYCSNHPKATVLYKFNDGIQRDFYIDKTPIEVKAVEKEIPTFTGGQCPIGYEVRYRYKLGAVNAETIATVGLSGAIQGAGIVGVFPEDAGYDRYDVGGGSGSFEVTLYIYHNNTRYQAAGSSGGFSNQAGFRPLRKDYYIHIISATPLNNQIDNCGNPKKICELQVINNGQIIHIDQGICPCTFSVSCGDCPEGTMRCECAGYPGFCCIPCNELKSGIRSITNYVRSINNG